MARKVWPKVATISEVHCISSCWTWLDCACVGGGRVGSAMLFRYQHVGTVYSGYSGHVYSGHSDKVATFPGTKSIYSFIFRLDIVANRI